ncbi:MAG: hypothetical protein ABIO24_14040 [Saprospiraceae bacterium]
MFSEPPLTVFKGLAPDTPSLIRFRASLQSLQTQPAQTAVDTLAESLRDWEQIGADPSAGDQYDPRELYCLRQSTLWEIYETAQRQQMQDAVNRLIYNRACKVLEQTPAAAQPANLQFRQGDDLIRKMLEHLRGIATFYQAVLASVAGRHGSLLIPPSPGFRRTNVLEANMDALQAEGLFQVFKNDNQYVRTILLGDDATAGATLVDNRLNIPGGGIKPGRGLWIKSYALLRPKISSWLAASLPHDYDQLRCIFISPKGKPVSFLTRSVPLDQANVSAELLNAADADDDDDLI